MPACTRCGVESPIEQAFSRSRRWYPLHADLLCPRCAEARQAAFTKGAYIFCGAGGILGILLGLSGLPDWLGWLGIAILLFLAFLWVLVPAHELAHAVSGGLLGMRVFGVVLGLGRTVYSRFFGGFRLELRSIPAGGFTLLAPKSIQSFGRRMFLIVLAGPMTHLFLLGLAIWLGKPSDPSDPFPVVLWRVSLLVFGGTNVLMLIVSLLAKRVPFGGFLLQSDGLTLFTIMSLPESAGREALALRYCLEAMWCLEKHESHAAVEWSRRGLATLPDDPRLLITLSATLIEGGEAEEAREVLTKLLSKEGMDPMSRAVALNNLAYADVMLRDQRLWEEADRSSREAYGIAPWIPYVEGTRGAVLVELGEIDKGLALLRAALEAHREPRYKAQSACHIALAEQKKGNVMAAGRYLELARQWDPECRLLARVEELLRAPVAPASVGST